MLSDCNSWEFFVDFEIFRFSFSGWVHLFESQYDVFIQWTWFNLISLLEIFDFNLINLFARGFNFIHVMFLFLWRWFWFLEDYDISSRRSRPYSEVHQKEAEEVPLNGFVKSRPVMLVDLKNYCAENHKNSDHGFQLEYEVCILYKAP